MSDLVDSPVSFQSTPDDPVLKRVETVGKVLPHVRAKLVSPDGEVVPVGKPGELLVAGYLLQKGYWNDEEHTRQVMKRDEEGTLWMHTGDEGITDEEGYLRSKRQIHFLDSYAVARSRASIPRLQSSGELRTSSFGVER